MRKALFGLVLAATAMTPFMAQAQDGRNWRGERGDDAGDEHAARAEQRRQQREARQAPQQVQQQQVQQEAPRQQFQRREVQPQQQQQFEQQVQRQQFQRREFQQQQQLQQQQQAQRQQFEQQQQQQAFGQRQRYDNGNRGNWRGNQTNQGSIYPQAWQGDPNDPRLRHYQELERRNQRGSNNDRGNWRNDRNDRGDWRNGSNDRRDWRGDRNGRNDWNREWRNDNRYDWQRYRYSNRNQFRVGPYYSPYRNYGYNRFSIGIFLDSLFYDQRYWIGDPWQYRLPPAYPGTQWIRYYNDVLLVDVYSGEVVDVIYDFFW